MKRTYTFLLLPVLLSGCATDGLNDQQQYLQQFAQTQWKASLPSAEHAASIHSLLATPLTRDDAVRVALTNSPAFHAMLADAKAATLVAQQNARPSNPILTFERLVKREDHGVDLDIGRMMTVSLLDWIYWPSRQAAAASQSEKVKLAAAAQMIETATNTQQAWVRAVASQQALNYFENVMEAADASAELAKRMYEVGNFSKLQRARQHAFYADAVAQLARARQVHTSAKENLIRVLGLNAEHVAMLRLPDRLPDLPTAPLAEPSVVQSSLTSRLDVQMAKAEINALGAAAGFDHAKSFINAFHLSGVRNSETGQPPQRGYELELPLPLFDFGRAARSTNTARYDAAMHRAAQTAIDAASLTREQYSAYRTALEVAQHYRSEIVPLRKLIADETLLKYNGMLTGVFDLLAETRAQIGSVILAIDAERDFWLADAALKATLLGKPMTTTPMSATAEVANASGH